MKNAAHRVAVSTRMKTVNGDEISAVGCDGQRKGRCRAVESSPKVRRCTRKRTSNSESDSCRWYETPARRLDDATMMPGRILRLFSMAIAKHKGHTLTFSMSVLFPNRSRESPVFVRNWFCVSSLSASALSSPARVRARLYSVATIVPRALVCSLFARVTCRPESPPGVFLLLHQRELPESPSFLPEEAQALHGA